MILWLKACEPTPEIYMYITLMVQNDFSFKVGYIFHSFLHFLEIEPMTLLLLAQCSTVWSTGMWKVVYWSSNLIRFSQVFSSFVSYIKQWENKLWVSGPPLSLVHGGHTSNVLSNMELNGQIMFFFFEKVMVFMKSFLRSFHSLINPLDPVWVCFLANHRKMSNSVFSLNVVNL